MTKAQLTSILLNLNSAAALIEAAFITARKANAIALENRFSFLHRLLRDEMKTIAAMRDEAEPSPS